MSTRSSNPFQLLFQLQQMIWSFVASPRAPSYRIGTGDIQILTGTGTPEGAVVAPVGSLFLRADGGASTTLYVKQTGVGNTGWVAK